MATATWVANTTGKTSAAPLDGTEEFRVNDGGSSKKATAANIKDYILGLANTWTAQNTFAAGTIATSQPFTITQTWNDGAGDVTYSGFLLNITDTESNSASLLMDLQIGGSSKFSITKAGQVVAYDGAFGVPGIRFSGGTDTGFRLVGSNAIGIVTGGGGSVFFDAAAGLVIDRNAILAWTNASGYGTNDLGLARNAAGVVEVNSGTPGTLRDLKSRALITPMTGELTIASGVVTATGGYHRIDTEADDATDDLDTINGGVDGMLLTIRAENDARTVVVKDATGNLQIAGDMTLDNTQDTITLRYDGTLTAWLEIGRAASGA